MQRATRALLHRGTALGIALISIALLRPAPAMTATAMSAGTTLAFGSFAAGTGGTVTVTPGNVRSATGGVTLLSGDAGSATSITVTGKANSTYTITLPADGVVALSDGAGHTMAVNSFVSIPSATTNKSGLLNAAGSQVMTIGATLTVSSGQTTGSYSGTYSVTVVSP